MRDVQDQLAADGHRIVFNCLPKSLAYLGKVTLSYLSVVFHSHCWCWPQRAGCSCDLTLRH
jgi:hypothetical protein